MYKHQLLLFFAFLSFSCAAQSHVADSLIAFKTLDSTFNNVYQSDPVKGIDISERMDKIATYLNFDSLRVRVTYNKALTSHLLGFSADAMELLFGSLKLAEAGGNIRMTAKIHYSIAISYQNALHDYTNATKHLRTAYDIDVANKIYKDTTFTNYSIAENLVFLGKKEEGISLLKDNITEAKKTDRYVMILGGLETLAFVYYKTGNNQASIACLYEILPYLDKIKSDYHYMIINLHIADMLIVMDQWENVNKHLDTALKYAAIVNSADWYEECYKVQSKVYAHEGKYEQALTAHKLFVKYKDSVNQKGYGNKIAALTARYGLEKKQAEIAILQKDNALRAVTVKQRELQRNVVLLAGILAIVVVIAFFKGWMSRRTKKLQMIFSRTLLNNQEADRQRIAHELHDSIGQNVLFIKNQVAAQPDDGRKASVLQAITATIDEIRDISKELYPNQLEKYGLAAAVNTLADRTMEATNIFMSASLEEVEKVLTKETKINCYRIIQECVTNTVKHAGAKAIRITGVIEKGKIALTILDNGKGFDTSLTARKAQSSFGLLGIEERAKILGGKMDLDTSPRGTRITITLPIPNHAA